MFFVISTKNAIRFGKGKKADLASLERRELDIHGRVRFSAAGLALRVRRLDLDLDVSQCEESLERVPDRHFEHDRLPDCGFERGRSDPARLCRCRRATSCRTLARSREAVRDGSRTLLPPGRRLLPLRTLQHILLEGVPGHGDCRCALGVGGCRSGTRYGELCVLGVKESYREAYSPFADETVSVIAEKGVGQRKVIEPIACRQCRCRFGSSRHGRRVHRRHTPDEQLEKVFDGVERVADGVRLSRERVMHISADREPRHDERQSLG